MLLVCSSFVAVFSCILSDFVVLSITSKSKHKAWRLHSPPNPIQPLKSRPMTRRWTQQQRLMSLPQNYWSWYHKIKNLTFSFLSLSFSFRSSFGFENPWFTANGIWAQWPHPLQQVANQNDVFQRWMRSLSSDTICCESRIYGNQNSSKKRKKVKEMRRLNSLFCGIKINHFVLDSLFFVAVSILKSLEGILMAKLSTELGLVASEVAFSIFFFLIFIYL